MTAPPGHDERARLVRRRRRGAFAYLAVLYAVPLTIVVLGVAGGLSGRTAVITLVCLMVGYLLLTLLLTTVRGVVGFQRMRRGDRPQPPPKP